MAPPEKVTSQSQPNTTTKRESDQAAARKFQARLVSYEGGSTIAVRSGDTLSKIAQLAGVKLDDLLAANSQFDAGSVDGVFNWSKKSHGKRDADCLRVGERIIIPGAASRPVSETPVQQPNGRPRSVQVKINEAPPRKSAPTPSPVKQDSKTGVADEPAPVVQNSPMPAPANGDPKPPPTEVIVTVQGVTVTTRSDGTTPVNVVINAAGAASSTTSTAQQTPAPGQAQGSAVDGVSAAKSPPTAPNPAPTPDPVLEIKPKDHNHLLMVTGGGSGAKDPKSADNRIGLNLESLDSNANPNTGTYQVGLSLTQPGRVQEPQSRLDATTRMTLFSFGRKPLKITDAATGKEQSVEAFGVKLGGMKAADRFGSVSAYANLAGKPIGGISQENGTAVDGKSAASPAHLGVAASLGSLNGFYAWGLGSGQTRNTATNTIDFKKTDIYGADVAVPFAFQGKVRLDKAHIGLTGRRTITTPENGVPGKPTFTNSAFVESYFKVNAGQMNSLLPGQSSSPKADAVGIFRMRFETPLASKLDPKLTLRYDQPLWEVRNVIKNADGKLEVTSQFRLEAMTALQLGISSENKAAMQNVTFGLRAKF